MEFTARVCLLLAFAGLLADYRTTSESYLEYSDEFEDRWAYSTSAEHYPGYDYSEFANLLAEYSGTYESDAEYGDKFEGDLILSKDQMRFLYSQPPVGITSKTFRWSRGRVFYKFDDGHFDPEHKSYILLAMQEIEEISCIRFYEAREYEPYYINITGFDDNCYSQVGCIRYPQLLNLHPHELDTGCFRVGTIVHELLHALGFYHQHTAQKRDEFITIVSENIQESMVQNFNLSGTKFVNYFGACYDYGSILHFHSTAFSENGSATIIPISSTAQIGQREGMSTKDIVKLNLMYDCMIPPEKIEQYAMVLCEECNR